MGVNLWGFGLFFNQHFVVRSCRCILTSFSLKTWYNSTFYHHQSSSLWQTKQCEFPAEQRKIFQLQSAIFPQFTSSPYFPFAHLFPSIKKKSNQCWKHKKHGKHILQSQRTSLGRKPETPVLNLQRQPPTYHNITQLASAKGESCVLGANQGIHWPGQQYQPSLCSVY